jgi:hypothetical protein
VLAAASAHLVVLVVAAGIAVGGVVALLAYAGGARGGHEVVAPVIALGALGALSVVIATLRDPMGFSDQLIWPPRHEAAQGPFVSPQFDGEELREVYHSDDVLLAGGALLIGMAVLLGFACKWAGVPPANPLG